MTQQSILTTLQQDKLIVVIRGETEEDAMKTVTACLEGGLKHFEITYTNPDANHIIKTLAKQHISVGAGSVFDSETARLAILAGAQYIVSPYFNQETAHLCHRYQVPYFPGCMSITEIATALETGCQMIKLFPASILTPDYISAIKGPLPLTPIMATGGINLYNIKDWLKTGIEAIGIGGQFNQLAKNGDFQQITALAREYKSIVSQYTSTLT